ncbi:MAG: TetR family transcriptional regulator [Myxococcota bacterium]
MGRSRDAPSAPLWKEPTQARSRERVDRMLAATHSLIQDSGAYGFTMQDVALGADVPVGSLYQFFPDRNALLARLFADFQARVDALFQKRFAAVETADQLETTAVSLVGALYRFVQQDPMHAELWRAVQASPALRHLDAEATRSNATRVFEAARPLVSEDVSTRRLRTACSMLCDLVGATVLKALQQRKTSGSALVREYAEMTRCYMGSLLDGDG